MKCARDNDEMASRSVGRPERPNCLQEEPRGVCTDMIASRNVGRTERTDGHRTREMRMANRMPGSYILLLEFSIKITIFSSVNFCYCSNGTAITANNRLYLTLTYYYLLFGVFSYCLFFVHQY